MQRLKKTWSVVSTVLVVLVVLCAVFLMGSRVMGYQVYTVISGSMEPNFRIGDLLYVKEVPAQEIRVGDAITFVQNEQLVVATHRVVRIDAEKQLFYTKGDANEIEDGAPVHFRNLIGRAEFSVPLLGYVSDFVQNPPGMHITIAVGAVLIILVFLPDFLPKKKPEEDASAVAEVSQENEKLKEELEALRIRLQEQTPRDGE